MCLTRVELHWLSLGSCLWCLRTYSASIRRHPSPLLIRSDHHHPPTPPNSDSRSPPAPLPPSPTIHPHLYASGLTPPSPLSLLKKRARRRASNLFAEAYPLRDNYNLGCSGSPPTEREPPTRARGGTRSRLP
ncbi:hypothetical protein BHE74_00012722 [Ensete ventricosum]|nr:hypothetical protein BHE74_00012722 [Ensete ventricosum]